MKVEYQLISDPSQFLQGVSVADSAQRKLSDGAKEFEKDSKKAYEEAGKGAKSYGDSTDSANTKTQSLKAQLAELKKQIATATDPKDVERLAKAAGEVKDKIDDANEASKLFASGSKFEIIGNQIGDITGKLRNMDFSGAAERAQLLAKTTKSISVKDAVQGVKDLGTTFINLGKALVTNPLVLFAAALAGIAYAAKSVYDAFSQLKIQTKTVTEAIEDSHKRIDDLTKAQAEYLIRLSVAQGKLSKEQGETVKKDIEHSSQRKQIAKKFSDDMLKLAKELELDLGELQGDRFKENYTGDINNLLARKRFNQEANKLQKQYLVDTITLTRTQVAETKAIQEEASAEAKKKAAEDAKQRLEEMKRNKEALAAALLDLFRRAQQAEADGLNGEAKLRKQKELNEFEVNELRKTIEKKGLLTDKNFKFTAEQEKEFAALREKINRDYYAGVLQLAVDAANKEAQANQKKVANDLASFELRYEVTKNNIEKTRALDNATVAEKLIFEQEKQKALLNAEKTYNQEKLNLVLQQIDAETEVKEKGLLAELQILSTRTDAISIARAEAIKKELDSIETNAELAKAAAMSATDNVVAEINDKLKEIKPTKINIGKLLQLDDQEIATTLNIKFNAQVSASDVSSAKQAVQQLAQSLRQIMDEYFKAENEKLDQELENNEKRIEAREKNIESLQSSLEAEKSLADQGLANNVERLQSAIDEQEKARQKDLANERRLKEEKKKLALEQFKIDTIMQGSQMVLAIAQLYGALSGFVVGPIPVGLIVATAASAAMVAAFATQKSNAYDAIQNQNKFAKGVIDLQGPGTDTSDSIPSLLSKGESVMTAKETKNNLKLFKGIRNRDNDLIQVGILKLLKDTGVVLPDISAELETKKSAIRVAEINSLYNFSNIGVEKRLDNVEMYLKTISEQSKNNETVLPNGDRIIKNGNITTKIKAKNG